MMIQAAAMLSFGYSTTTTNNPIHRRIPTIGNALHDAVSYPRRPNRFVGKCSSDNPAYASVGETRLEVLEVLKSELFNEPVFEWTDFSRQWVDQMIDYNVPRGKLLRSIALFECYKSLKEDPTEDELFLASVLGWCMELFHSAILMQDDIMDNSEMRRGQTCWYRVPKVGNIAIVDGVLLQYQVPRILKKHFGQQPYYLDLLDLFNEAEYQTVLGQMLDVITTVEGERDLLKYSWTLYHLIAKYKTSIYTFYFPVACALLLAGENLDDHANVKDVLLDMGSYFQVLNDYQDCFGDPKMSGKIGTDIEDFKCSWIILKAMELSNAEQKKILLENYGKSDPVDVAKVKAIYNDMGVRGVCDAYLRNNYDQLQRRVEAHPSKAVHAIWDFHTMESSVSSRINHELVPDYQDVFRIMDWFDSKANMPTLIMDYRTSRGRFSKHSPNGKSGIRKLISEAYMPKSITGYQTSRDRFSNVNPNYP